MHRPGNLIHVIERLTIKADASSGRRSAGLTHTCPTADEPRLMKATAMPVLSWRRQIWLLLHPPGHLTRLPCMPAASENAQHISSFCKATPQSNLCLNAAHCRGGGCQDAPSGSWLMAMTSLLSRMLRCEAVRFLTSLPMIRGAAKIAQAPICSPACASVIPCDQIVDTSHRCDCPEGALRVVRTPINTSCYNHAGDGNKLAGKYQQTLDWRWAQSIIPHCQ